MVIERSTTFMFSSDVFMNEYINEYMTSFMNDTINMYTRYWVYTKATLEKMEQKVFSVFTRDQYFEFGYNTSAALIVRSFTFH